MTTIQNNFNDVHIQCFVDDIFIMSNSKNCLEKAFETDHKLIIRKKMDLNIDKCDYLSADADDSFIYNISKNII